MLLNELEKKSILFGKNKKTGKVTIVYTMVAHFDSHHRDEKNLYTLYLNEKKHTAIKNTFEYLNENDIRILEKEFGKEPSLSEDIKKALIKKFKITIAEKKTFKKRVDA